MALSPADFYAYSRATGAPIPEDPQERAEMAPEVLEFRRNQLKAPQQESNPLGALGTAAAAVGALAGLGFGARALMRRGQQIPKGPAKSATAGVRQVNLADMEQAVRRVAAEPALSTPAPAPSKVAARSVMPTEEETFAKYARELGEAIPEPTAEELNFPPAQYRTYGVGYRERAAEPGYRSNALAAFEKRYPPSPEVQAARRAAAQEDLLSAAARLQTNTETLTDIQKVQALINADQFINAVESGEDQITGRRTEALQRDVHPDVETNLVPQEENTRALSSEELKNIALAEMMQLRQTLTERGLRPGTTRFDRALAASWTSKAGSVPGTEAFRESISLPKTIRSAVEAVTPDIESMGGIEIPERTVVNIGPNAVITQTAAGTAIRGAAPSYHEALPKTATRQLFGNPDVLVPGAPDELGLDLPGGLRITGGLVPDAPPEQLSKQEIIYSVLDRPSAEGPAGGSAGVGVYGLEPSYVPGAVSKSTGQYSAAAERQPTYVPGWLQRKENKIGPASQFAALNLQQLTSGLEQAKSPSIKAAFQTELNRRNNVIQSVAASEMYRRAKIEGLI